MQQQNQQYGNGAAAQRTDQIPVGVPIGQAPGGNPGLSMPNGERRTDFRVGLCDCFGECSICLASTFICFWPCVIGQIGNRTRRWPLGATNMQGAMYRIAPIVLVAVIVQLLVQTGIAAENPTLGAILNFVNFVASIALAIIVYSVRTQTRQVLGYTPQGCCDCLASCFCQCCSVAQVAQEVNVKEPFSTKDLEIVDVFGNPIPRDGSSGNGGAGGVPMQANHPPQGGIQMQQFHPQHQPQHQFQGQGQGQGGFHKTQVPQGQPQGGVYPPPQNGAVAPAPPGMGGYPQGGGMGGGYPQGGGHAADPYGGHQGGGGGVAQPYPQAGFTAQQPRAQPDPIAAKMAQNV